MEASSKPKLAMVFGNLPTVEEIDQFRLLKDGYDIAVVSTESICGYLNDTSRFNNLRCLALPDYDDNPTYMPGLENVLADFDIVVVKERLGLYAYQVVKAKWRHRFRLAVWVDNLAVLPGHDISEMNTIRSEVTNATDAFLVQTDAASKVLELEGVEKERIYKFTPWVEKTAARNKKTRAQALETLGLPEGSILLTYFGQMEWEESLTDFISATKLAVEADPAVARRLKLAFCGIGSFAGQFGDLLLSLGVDDRAIFVAPGREAFIALQNASDAIFMSPLPARDRVDGDPYRILSAMTNEVPILASRSAVIEELCGKHRIDFCQSSPTSIMDAIVKLMNADSIRNNIVKKNAATVKAKFSEKIAKEKLLEVFSHLGSQQPSIDETSLDHQVRDVESLVASKQYLKAIDVIESIFQIESVATHHQANLYRLIGDCFAKLSDSESAKNAYIKAIEIDPFSAKSYIGLGTVGLVKQSHDIAVIHFQKAVSLAPDDEMANLGLGLAFQGMSEFDEARKWVLKSLDINADNTVALYTLVRIAYEIDNYADSEQRLVKYLERHPHDHNMLFTLGGLQFKLGKYNEALEVTKRILEIDPMDERAHGLSKQVQRALEQSATSNA